MITQSHTVVLIILVAVFIVAGSLLLRHFSASPAPDFQAISAGKERKQAFFEYFRPLVQRANAAISDDRRRLLALADAGDLSWWQRQQLQGLADDYDLDTTAMTSTEVISKLLHRVGEVPTSLALAQAAKESGWGTARFAVEGNNYFGQRCWEAGCGMMPRNREAGMKHEVARFHSPYDSLTSYIRNLNTHPEYQELRAVRAQLSAGGSRPLGSQLAAKLNTYSERRQAYIDEIRALIRVNQLEQKP